MRKKGINFKVKKSWLCLPEQWDDGDSWSGAEPKESGEEPRTPTKLIYGQKDSERLPDNKATAPKKSDGSAVLEEKPHVREPAPVPPKHIVLESKTKFGANVAEVRFPVPASDTPPERGQAAEVLLSADGKAEVSPDGSTEAGSPDGKGRKKSE